METVNRGWLKRQMAAGNVVMVGSYHFDDLLGSSRSSTEMPTKFRKEGEPREYKEGLAEFSDFDFTSNSGRAYWENKEKGLVHLRVHSNYNVTLKVLPK